MHPTQEGMGVKTAQEGQRTRSRLKKDREHAVNATKVENMQSTQEREGTRSQPNAHGQCSMLWRQRRFGNDQGTTIMCQFDPLQHKAEEKR